MNLDVSLREPLRRTREPRLDDQLLHADELMFGFWRFLLDSRHPGTLWAPALRHAFPHLRPKVRTEVYDRVERLNTLRNRVAHHEPVHYVPLDDRWRDLLAVAGWICPTTAAWIWSTSTLPAILAAKP